MSKTKALGGLMVVLLAIQQLLAQSPQPWSTSIDAGPFASTPEDLPPPAEYSPFAATDQQANSVRQLAAPACEEHPETLEQAMVIALEAHPLMAAEELNAAAAAERLRASRAERFPEIGLDVGYIVRSDTPAFALDADTLGQLGPLPFDRLATNEQAALQMGALGIVPLYTSGQISRSIDAASAQLDAAEMQVRIARMNLKLNVAAAYVFVIRAEWALAVALGRLRGHEMRLHELTQLCDQRQVSHVDLLAARVALDNARQELVRARTDVDNAWSEYNRLLQRPLDSRTPLAGLTRPGLTDDLESLSERAVARRPELAQLAAQRDVLRNKAAAIRADQKPHIDLQSKYYYEDNRFQTPKGLGSLFVGMHWNTIDGGRARHEANALQKESARMERLWSDTQSMIRQEVRHAWHDHQAADHRIDITATSLQHAAEHLRVTQQLRLHGRATEADVLEAAALQISAQGQFNDAINDAALAFIRLQRATGDL